MEAYFTGSGEDSRKGAAARRLMSSQHIHPDL